MDSMPYVVAAMNAIFRATASCEPTGRPHWTLAADHSRDSEIQYLDFQRRVVTDQHDIVWFQVAMNYSVLVCVSYGGQGLRHYRRGALGRFDSDVLQFIAEQPAGNELHHQIIRAIVLAEGE